MKLCPERGRRNLVTRRDYTFNGNSVYWYSTDFDLLARPTNAVDSISIVRTYLYNRRSELAAAQIGTNSYGYTYDTIGNRQWSSVNSMTNAYSANSLNQYATILHSTFFIFNSYDADGNLIQDDRFAYAYDAENRLISVDPRFPVEGAFAVENRYNHKNLRVRKIVRRYTDGEWIDYATHGFTYDGGNIVLERITFADGTIRTCEYFWGNDLSGTEQGAGGVGGLIAVSIDGMYFIPCYDHNGNIVCYVSETGTIAAQYVYDPYGNVIEAVGSNVDLFSFGFSTKYHDREVGLIGYQYRYLGPVHGRWLNRDPMEEDGDENLYAFCGNDSVSVVDALGLFSWTIKPTKIVEDLGKYGSSPSMTLFSNWPVQKVPTYNLALTGVDWLLNVTCSCSKGGKWALSDVTGTFTPIIHLRSDYSGFTSKISKKNLRDINIKAENDHVGDLVRWAKGAGNKYVNDFIREKQSKLYSKKDVCERLLFEVEF